MDSKLSDEGKKRLEEITLAAFHNLLLGVVDNVVKQLDESTETVAGIQHDLSEEIVEAIKGGKYATL